MKTIRRQILRSSPQKIRTKWPTLFVASLSIPVVGFNQTGLADPSAESTTVRVKHVYYRDSQSGDEDRIKVNSPMFLINSSLSDSWELEAGFTVDSVSGASPLYLDALSGASGKGIEDRRTAGDLKFTKSFENFSVGLGGAISDEDDYTSRSAALETKIWTPDKNTTFAFGFSTDWDSVGSTNLPELDEFKRVLHYMTGITQVINPVVVVQSNITYSSGEGFFNDPYKVFDQRPNNKDEWAWLTRLMYYIKDLDAALHADYRLYLSSWDIASHTFEFRWYQPITKYLTVRPLIRYYSQDSAEFFLTNTEQETFERHSSFDQRLSSFGGLTYGIKFVIELSKNINLDLLYERIEQTDSLKFGTGTQGIKDFSADYAEAGLAIKF